MPGDQLAHGRHVLREFPGPFCPKLSKARSLRAGFTGLTFCGKHRILTVLRAFAAQVTVAP